MSLRNVLKEIAVGVFGNEQRELRAAVMRAGSAVTSAYAESVAERDRNASIAVKYLAVDDLPTSIPVEGDHPLTRIISSTDGGQDAINNGLRICVAQKLPSGSTEQVLLRQVAVQYVRESHSIILQPREYILARKEEVVQLPHCSPYWWYDALAAV